MLKNFISADHRKRGLATIIISVTLLVTLLFLSLFSVPGQGVTLWLDWNVQLFCTSNSTFSCEEWSIDFNVKYLFVVAFMVSAIGLSDYFGLFSRASKTQ